MIILLQSGNFLYYSALLGIHIENFDLIFVDGSYFKMETRNYTFICNVITNLTPLKDSPLPEVKSVQMAEFALLIRA